MAWKVEIPRFAASTVESGKNQGRPILDGGDATIANLWSLPPHTVALVGRPAVWAAFDIATPAIRIGSLRIPSWKYRSEHDFGGHLYLAVASADAKKLLVIEGGPTNPDGTGALVPFDYPEQDFAERGVIDFEPVVVEPPHGLSVEYFADLVRAAHRAYDGNQRYRAIEIPFFRVGRDSNSYAVGVLRACGLDPRDIPKFKTSMRWEITGYPGARDPVPRSNFGNYFGEPTHLHDDAYDIASHDDTGDIRFVMVGGRPRGIARLPNGETTTLDRFGRRTFAPEDARRAGLPQRRTKPPEQIRKRQRFPSDPAPGGAETTIVVGGKSVALEPDSVYRGRVTARNDALGIAVVEGDDGNGDSTARIVLPIWDLGVELRDPNRVDRLFRPGTDVTLGLDRDRHPRLRAHGLRGGRDRLRFRRFHAPRAVNVAGTVLGIAAVAAFGATWFVRRFAR